MAVKQKRTVMAGAIMVALGFAAAPASGQATGTQGSQSRAQQQGTPQSRASSPISSPQAIMVDMRASKLMGKTVRNVQGKELGELSDMVVDLSSNRIQYAIVERGGVLGVGEKATAVPISAFRSGARDGELVLNIDEEQLKSAPGIKRDAAWNDPRIWSNIGQYYNQTLGMAGAGQAGTAASNTSDRASTSRPGAANSNQPSPADSNRFQRASEVLGMDVVDPAGKEVGEIEDLVVNLSNGTIHYAVLEFDRAWNPVDKLVALPMSALQPKAGSNDLTINMTREQLANAPSFENSRWPSLTDSQFRERVGGFERSSATGMERRSGSSSATPGGQGGASSSQPATSSGSSGSSSATRGSGTTSGQSR